MSGASPRSRSCAVTAWRPSATTGSIRRARRVGAGQHVAEEEPLVGLESDKATMEVPAPFAGVVAEMKVAVGDKVSEGATLLVLDVAGENGASAPEVAERPGRPASEAGA